ncbi:MAG: FKBP-type peptidyl-prolyl cis-trans isomerase [Vicinamibacterales bacterium]
MPRIPALVIAALLFVAACGGDSSPTAPSPPRGEFSQTDLVVGSGVAAAAGRVVSVNYTGWLYDPAQPEGKGTQFDTSVGRGPFAFVLGSGGVIRGWDQGVVGMRVGGQRRLVIPPELAYGASGRDIIPPNATLVFDIVLLSVQ